MQPPATPFAQSNFDEPIRIYRRPVPTNGSIDLELESGVFGGICIGAFTAPKQLPFILRAMQRVDCSTP
ncbi:hypothetical protein V1282_005584 [Nitrobacteraceae bacterium AZCC 2146]